MPNEPDRYMQLKLIALGEHMTAALKAQEWDSVRGIDQRIRECLEEMARMETLSPELQACKKQVQELYARALPAYMEACEKMRQLLLAQVDYAEARSAYLRTDLLQGDK
jgi:hypothetical protein